MSIVEKHKENCCSDGFSVTLFIGWSF